MEKLGERVLPGGLKVVQQVSPCPRSVVSLPDQVHGRPRRGAETGRYGALRNFRSALVTGIVLSETVSVSATTPAAAATTETGVSTLGWTGLGAGLLGLVAGVTALPRTLTARKN